MFDDAFWAIHSDLPREGPGDDASTARALSMMDLPPSPRILDIGCGPGMQTLELARRSGGRITAVDRHAPFLDDLRRRAEAAGLAERVEAMAADMTCLPFPDASFDALWSEGAIYLMGFVEGLTAWKRLLKPGGHIAVSEAVFFQARDEAPPEVLAFFADYAAMTTAAETLARAEQAGFEVVGSFPLPPTAWMETYYGPIEARLAALRASHGADPAYAARIAEAQDEIDLYRRHGDTYGYLFVVMRSR